MDPSDELKLDENLARYLAACDQDIDGGDAKTPTVTLPFPANHSITDSTELPSISPDLVQTSPIHQTSVTSIAPASTLHRVGRFELRRQLGRGGCGIVFLAFDPKLKREVALKLPRPEMLMNPDAKNRLIREALAAAEFDHPNLVPVYETGEIGPICFIATAFCPGQTLADWLDKQAFPVPVRQGARIVATIADAVQHAHDRGVLHRDLKPNNVILQEMKVEEYDEPPPGSVQLRGDYFVPRLVDFGLAKVAERGGPSETGTRQILGTPKYMAPEQAQARREDIGPPADVYALGVMLYEMLAGRAPYDGASDVEVLRQSVEGKPTPPRHLRPDIPRDLEAICLKAMARLTADRYRTVIDLADDLRRFLDGLPTIARPLAWSGRAVRWLRRNDNIVAVALLTAIAGFFTAVGTWSSYKSRQFRSDRDNVLRYQAGRNRYDQQREYSRHVREAFLGWRSGNKKSATHSLDSASRILEALSEPTEFTLDYLNRLLKNERLMIVCPAGSVTALAVSLDGTRLASGHADGTLCVWDRATGNHLCTIQGHETAVAQAGFVLNSTMLVTADSSSNKRNWNISKDGLITPGAAAEHPIVKPAFTMNGTPGRVLLNGQFDLATGDTGTVRTGIFSADGKTFFTGSEDGIIRSWDVAHDGRERATWNVGRVAILAVAPDGNAFVLGLERSLQQYSTTPVGKSIETGPRHVRAVCMLPNGRMRVVGFDKNAVNVVELIGNTTNELLRTPLPSNRTPTAIALSPDGLRVAVGDSTGHITVWSVAKGTAHGTIDSGIRRPVRGVAISYDGHSVASRTATGISVWNVGTPESMIKIECDDQAVFRFLPGGDRIAIAGRDGVVRVWHVSGMEETALLGHVGRVTGLGISPDGRTLVSGGVTGEVKFWDLKTGQELFSLRRHSTAVTAIEFAANGKFLVTGGDGQVAVWDAR